MVSWGYMYLLHRISLFLVVAVGICSDLHTAFAQTNTNNSDGSAPVVGGGEGGDTGRLSIEELVGRGGESLALKYDDMPQEYGGFRRSPILFSREKGKNRMPSFSTFSMDAGMNPNSRERTWNNIDGLSLTPPLDLSTDDELVRSSIAAFRPINKLHDEFLGSEVSRDSYLDSFQSVRAIANLTLSYLDKTVAAGLATTKQQADMDGLQQILRQVNLNVAKTANPQRRRVFDDIDEKFEACMTGEGKEDFWVGSEFYLKNYPEDAKKMTFNVYEQCKPVEGSTCYPHLKGNKGRYNFCVCCTENVEYATMSTRGADINWSDVAGSAKKGVTFYGEGYSLIDRAFLGRKVPAGMLREKKPVPGTSALPEDNNVSQYEAGYLIYDFSTLIRALYGDVIYTTEKVARGGGNIIPGKYIRRTISPLLSVPQWVQALRDAATLKDTHPFNLALNYNQSATNIQERGWWENHEGMWLRYSPAMGAAMKCGVCPAVRALINLEKKNILDDYIANSGEAPTGAEYECAPGMGLTGTSKSEHVANLWADMSIGGAIMTVADLRAMAEIAETGEGQRFIKTFCDTSAVEGMKRLHRRVQTMALDFLAANTKISNEERATIHQLIDRVSTYLDLGTKDSRSQVDEMLMALGASRDRRIETERSAVVAAVAASENRTQSVRGILNPMGGALPE